MNKSKNIVITGASTGIGYHLVHAFTRRGYTVFGSVRKKDDGKRLSEEFAEAFHPIQMDVTDFKQVDACVNQVGEMVGSEGIGGLVNNAGIAIGGPFLDLDIEEFRKQFEVNVIGLVKVTQAFLPLLGARESHGSLPGRIVQISSSSGKLGMPFVSPYVGSKHAVEGISESLRRELQYYGIDVIVIGPGPIKTPIWDKSAGTAQIEKFKDSDFYPSLKHFEEVHVAKAVKTAWTPEKAAKHIIRAFESTRPKTRYALVPNRWTNWILPLLLPPRVLDTFVKKSLKLEKNKL